MAGEDVPADGTREDFAEGSLSPSRAAAAVDIFFAAAAAAAADGPDSPAGRLVRLGSMAKTVEAGAYRAANDHKTAWNERAIKFTKVSLHYKLRMVILPFIRNLLHAHHAVSLQLGGSCRSAPRRPASA